MQVKLQTYQWMKREGYAAAIRKNNRRRRAYELIINQNFLTFPLEQLIFNI